MPARAPAGASVGVYLTATQKSLSVAAFIVAGFAVACSSNEAAKAPAEAGASGTGVDLAAPADGAGMQLALKWTLAPGEEKTNCLLGVAPTAEGGAGVYATAFEHQFTKQASHHLMLYPTALTAEDVAKYPGIIEDCTGVSSSRTGVYYGSQGPEGSVKMPADVGLLMPSASVLLAEFHTINTGLEPRDVEVRVNIEYTTVKPRKEAGVLFYYDQAIHVPPASSAKAGMHCNRPIDINLMQVGSHMHARGVGFTARVTDPSGADVASLYDTTDWEGPKGRTFDPPLRVSKDDGIEFECEYKNPGASDYFEGFSATNDEMCVLTGLYYADEGVPRMDTNPFTGSPEWCQNVPDSLPRTYGTGGCTKLRQCVDQLNSEVGATTNAITTPRDAYRKWQTCITDTADSAVLRFNEYGICRGISCTTECRTPKSGADAGPGWDVFGAACQSCLATNCSEPMVACATD